MRNFIKKILLLLLLVGCTRRLTIQTHYLTIQSLASYYVGTPDPQLANPPIGQRLIITWSLNKEDLSCKKIYLNLKVRWANRHEELIIVNIQDYPLGYYIYELVNEKFIESGGIQTYKAELISDQSILETWTHPLWKNLIQFNSMESNSNG